MWQLAAPRGQAPGPTRLAPHRGAGGGAALLARGVDAHPTRNESETGDFLSLLGE